MFAPALFLASRLTDGYPDTGFAFAPEAPTPSSLVDDLRVAVRLLTGVVSAASPADRATLFRWPTVVVAPPADFVPRAALELVLHADDVCGGLGVGFEPPADGCDRLRRHTAEWPPWTVAPGWSPLTLVGDPWRDLLAASGRVSPGGPPRP